MGEIDTKPIEPVRTALSLFEDKSDHQKNYQPMRTKQEYEKEMEELSKELANYKVKLEAKNAAHMQALFKLEQSQKVTYELSTLLKNSDSERNKYMNECVERRARVDELESKVIEMTEQMMKNVNVQEQLMQVLNELKATQREILTKETELAEARDSEMKALRKAEEMENAFKVEKLKKKELLHQVMKELKEAIRKSKIAAIEVEKERLHMLSDRDQTIELTSKAFDQAQKQVEDLKKQIEILRCLENESTSNATKEDSKSLQMELNQLIQEHHNAKEEIYELNINIQSLKDELHKAKEEAITLKEKDLEAFKEHKSLTSHTEKTKQVQDSEVALLRKELEVAMVKIGELRARAEQASSRAESAERAKEALEDTLRRQREEKQRRKASISGMHKEISTPKQDSQSSSDGTPKKYYPLGKVLNMKF